MRFLLDSFLFLSFFCLIAIDVAYKKQYAPGFAFYDLQKSCES